MFLPFIITLSHDNGKMNFRAFATTSEGAIIKVMSAENCPIQAIEEVKIDLENVDKEKFKLYFQNDFLTSKGMAEYLNIEENIVIDLLS